MTNITNFKNKRIDIELMRIIAAFFVIFNHTGNTGFFLFSGYNANSIQYWFYLFITVFCKMAVPLFLMITGALLLDREPEPIKTLWVHRILHMSNILLVWSFFYYMVAVSEQVETFSLKHFLGQLYYYNWNGSFWYIYWYISILITLPFLQRIAKNLTNKEFCYLVALYVVASMVIPCLEYIVFQDEHTINTSLSVGWITGPIHPLVGYYISCRQKSFWDKRRILLLWGVNIITIFLSCYLTYYRSQVMGICDEANSQLFLGTFSLINATAIFVTCQYLKNNTKLLNRFTRQIESVGGCTFGVYLLHMYLKDHTDLSRVTYEIFMEKLQTPPMLYAMILCVIVFVIGFVITLIIKQLPLLKKLVS